MDLRRQAPVADEAGKLEVAVIHHQVLALQGRGQLAQHQPHNSVAHHDHGNALAEIVEASILLQQGAARQLLLILVAEIHQAGHMQFALHFLQVVAHLTQTALPFVIAQGTATLQHHVVVAGHGEEHQPCHKAVEHVLGVDFAAHALHGAAHHLVPVDLHRAIRAVGIGIVHTSALVVEGFQLQVGLASPAAHLRAQGGGNLALHRDEVQVQRFIRVGVGHVLVDGILQTAVEDGITRTGRAVANDGVWPVGQLLVGLALLLLLGVACLGLTAYAVGGLHRSQQQLV